MMKRWIVIVLLFGVLAVAWAMWTKRPYFNFATMVETPELDRHPLFMVDIEGNKYRVTPRVDLAAPSSVIRWPAFRSARGEAQPLQLTIAKAQWAADMPLVDNGFVGPQSVALRLDWPETAEERAKAPVDEAPVRVTYFRRQWFRDPLTDAEIRADRDIHFASPDATPREEAVVVRCIAGYDRIPCKAVFEHLGRPAQVEFPRRRLDDWEAAYTAARGLVRGIATPIAPR